MGDGLRTHTDLSYSTLLIYYVHKMNHCSCKSLFVGLNLANIVGIFCHQYAAFRSPAHTHTTHQRRITQIFIFVPRSVIRFCVVCFSFSFSNWWYRCAQHRAYDIRLLKNVKLPNVPNTMWKIHSSGNKRRKMRILYVRSYDAIFIIGL